MTSRHKSSVSNINRPYVSVPVDSNYRNGCDIISQTIGATVSERPFCVLQPNLVLTDLEENLHQ